MNAGEVVAVLDAGPLIHLDELGMLHLLAGYREVLLPEIVERDAREHRPEINMDSIVGLVRISSAELFQTQCWRWDGNLAYMRANLRPLT